MNDVITIHRHIMTAQRDHPEARGDLSLLLSTMATAAKVISQNVNKAGLLQQMVLGSSGVTNVQGEEQKKLDALANDVIRDAFDHSGAVAGFASEEEDGYHVVPANLVRGRYVILTDPLDGSSNIDANVSIGTIVAIYKKVSTGPEVTGEDFLQPGRKLVAAGYAVYGSSTMLVYTTGKRVDGFTLDPGIGEFLLSHPDLRAPEQCKCYSVNERNSRLWDAPTRRYVAHVRDSDDPRYKGTSARYIGSLVADFHRNLLYGGVFLYPTDSKSPEGKLRLMYEANPLAFIAEAAGQSATTGQQRILDVQPTALHQRVPLVIGNRAEVELYERMIAEG